MRQMLLLIFSLASCAVYGSDPRITYDTLLPRVGSPLTPITFENVEYGKTRSVKFPEKDGKWKLLYFWNQGCASCLESMPNLNKYQKKYVADLSILLVGYNGSQYGGVSHLYSIKKIFDKQVYKHKLSLAVAYDSNSFHQMGIYACPVIIIVDPFGVVKGVTGSIIENDIELFISGKIPKLPRILTPQENTIRYQKNKPLLIENNGGYQHDFSYRTIVSSWKDYMPIDWQFKIMDSTFQVSGVKLSDLFLYAYLGISTDNFRGEGYFSNFPWASVTVRDDELFKADMRLAKNLFCYSLFFDKLGNNTDFVRECLRNDLAKVFKLSGKIVKAKKPVWVLIGTKNDKQSNVNLDSNCVKYEGSVDFLSAIYYFAKSGKPILIDKSNTKERIPIPRDCDFTDVKSLNHWLSFSSLKLVVETRLVNVLHIKDIE